jgi:hypothetical protein
MEQMTRRVFMVGDGSVSAADIRLAINAALGL